MMRGRGKKTYLYRRTVHSRARKRPIVYPKKKKSLFLPLLLLLLLLSFSPLHLRRVIKLFVIDRTRRWSTLSVYSASRSTRRTRSRADDDDFDRLLQTGPPRSSSSLLRRRRKKYLIKQQKSVAFLLFSVYFFLFFHANFRYFCDLAKFSKSQSQYS